FVLAHLIELPGFALCIFPGICVMTMFVAVAPAIVAERLGPFAGMGRSWRLVASRFWQTMGVALLTGLLSTFLSNVLATPFNLVAVIIGFHWGWILTAIGGILAAFVAQPF